MIIQYPDSITITIPPLYFQNEATGDFSSGSFSETVLTFDCRAESGKPGEVGQVDGVEPAFMFIIYAEVMTTQIPIGAEYTLTRRGVTFTGRIKGCTLNQLNTVLWG